MRSKLSPVHIPDNISVWSFMRERLEHHSERNKVALIDGPTGRRYTYRELLTSIRNVSSALLQRGFQKGDILCVISDNCCEYPMAVHGAISIGGILTTCDSLSTVDDIRCQLEECGVRWIVTSLENIAKVRDAVQHIHTLKDIFVIGDTSFSALTSYKSTNDIVDDVAIDPRNDVAAMFYTSGTTGKPKGTMVSHYNLVADIQRNSHPSLASSRSPGEEVYIAELMFSHLYGCRVFLYQCLANGDTVVIHPKYDAIRFVEYIQKYKATVLVLIPPVVVDILQRAEAGDRTTFASVHTILSSGAALSADLLRNLQHLTGIRRVQQFYGMTETGPTHMLEWDDDSHPGSVGSLMCNTEGKVVNPQTGEELGPYEDGEMLIRGPTVMKGYFAVSSADDLDADGWMHTGDMMHYDSTGRFYVVDRYKQLIKYKGMQVSPTYLENMLLTHPAVTDAAVVGLPDLRVGELPAAFVVLKDGSTATEAEIQDFVNEMVSPYNKLRGGVMLIEKVPRSAVGKILRRQLTDEAVRKLNVTSTL